MECLGSGSLPGITLGLTSLTQLLLHCIMLLPAASLLSRQSLRTVDCALSNGFLVLAVARRHLMDPVDTLSLEGLTLGKTKAKRDYTARRANRRKGRERQKNKSANDDSGSKGHLPHGPSPNTGKNDLPCAAPYEHPLYTALDIPPLGGCLPLVHQIRPVHTPKPNVSFPLWRDALLASDQKPNVQPKQASESYPRLAKSRASVPASKGFAFNQTSISTATLTSDPLLAPFLAPIGSRSAAPLSDPSASGARVDKRVRFISAASLPAGHHPHRSRIPSLPVPIPTQSYLALASRPPIPLSRPQHLLIVLDLNGTLLVRKKAGKTFHPRQSLQPFLDYCFAKHSLLVWSSATPHNVHGVCSTLFTPAQRSQLLGEWGRDTLGLTPAQYREHVQVYKCLSTVWADEGLQARHPGAMAGERWDQSNTVLIDDSKAKAMAQPWNLVQVPEFVRQSTGEEGDVLGQVVRWLEEAMGWSDVSGFCGVMGKAFRVDGGWEWDFRGPGTEEGAQVKKGRSGAGGARSREAGYQVQGDDISDDEDGGVRI